MGLQYLPNEQIDRLKWDKSIFTAGNGLIYACSFYLDKMASHWDALVLNDYEMVMPLTWNKKYGFYYLYQPPFTPCLGVFGNNITTDILHQFLGSVPSKFRYWDISLNQGNSFPLKGFNLYQRVNYVLDLEKPYEELFGEYRDNIKRNIKKSEQAGLVFKTAINPAEVVALAKKQAAGFSLLKQNDFDRFLDLYTVLNKKEQAVSYGIYSPSGQLMASALFFFYQNRACYILVGNHPDGKTIGASHALIDAFIKDHAGKELLLDFEGSDIASLAFFYSSFGAKEENYTALQMNRLPILLKWLKKN